MSVEIGADDALFRRIFSHNVKPDGSLSSNTFMFKGRPDPHVSVDLARLTTVAESAARRPGCGIVSLSAQVPLSLGPRVEHDPNPLEDVSNYVHTLIIGMTPTSSDKERCRRLAEQSRVVLEIGGIQPAPLHGEE